MLEDYAKSVDMNDEQNTREDSNGFNGLKERGDENTKMMLGKMVIKAVRQVMEKDASGKIVVDHDFIKVEKKAGGNVGDTQFINGVLIDKEIAHPGMPKSVKDAKIALLDVALEIEKTETDARIEITSPEQMQAFLQQEEKTLKEMVGEDKEERRQCHIHTEGHRRCRTALPFKGGNNRSEKGKEERHGKAGAGLQRQR